MVNIKEYTKNYNIFLKELNKIRSQRKSTKPATKKETENLLNLAEKYGLKVDRNIKRIYSPENIKSGTFCKSWEKEYHVPKGNWLANKSNTCGTGCLCVDKGADTESLDKINSLKSIEVGQVCDGSKEHKPRTNTTPLVAFDYKSKKPINLENLKTLCSSAKTIVVNDIDKNTPNIRNLCTNDVGTLKEKKDTLKREKEFYKGKKDSFGKKIVVGKNPSVIIMGKRYNDEQFWKDTARVLSDIELPIKQTTPIKKPKTIKTDYGEASIFREKSVKIKTKSKSSSFMGLGGYI